MLKIFSYNNPFVYGFLLVCVILLRLPSFHPQYFGTDESYYMLAAQEIVEGGTQYVDTWDNKPPVIVWVYTLFVWLFGSGAFVAIRIFTILYLFISAVILNQMVMENKFLKNFSILPAFLFLLLISIPWYCQELNGEQLMILPVILAFNQVFNVRERAPENGWHLFLAGILIGLSFMIKYQAIMLFLGVIVGYLVTWTPRLSDVMSFIGGFLFSIIVILTIIYFSGALPEYWDLGILYNLDYIFIGTNPGEESTPLSNLGQYFKLWGVFMLIAGIVVVHFRLQSFTYAIRIRKIESILLFWLGASVFTLLPGAGRLYLHYFYLIIPPLVIYVSKLHDLRIRYWIASLLILAGLVWPVITFGHFMVAAFPQTFAFVDRFVSEDGWVKGKQKELNQAHILTHYVDPGEIENGVLILDFEPDLYYRLGVPAYGRYTNFSVAYYKFDLFSHSDQHKILSSREPASRVFRTFRDLPPDVIIDRDEPGFRLFPQIRERMPLLFAHYNETKAGKYRVYSRQ
ncbi:MAG: glycosyltransferase family 39 protein [Bacteroidia bacterium]|nr:glycosyltransferase family 39 protein [Bacteroidia bacterium]